MKKILLFVWGLLFIVCFTACNKEKLQPNNAKKEATGQSQSSQESPAQAPPDSGCPHPPPSCPHAAGNPIG